MAIVYPIALPAVGKARVTLTQSSIVAINRSPFTGQAEVQEHPGQLWRAEVGWGTLKRAEAEPLIAALMQLKGRFGTFLMGDPLGASPRGSAALGAAVTNRQIRSDAFDDAAWGKQGVTVSADAATAPDGSASADKIVEDASAGALHRVTSQSFGALLDNTDYTLSVYAKAAERSWLAVQTGNKAGATYDSWFDIGNGAPGLIGAGHAAAIRRLRAPHDAWFRLSIGFNSGAGASGPFYTIGLATGDAVGAYDGDGTSGAYLWRAQLVQGADPGADVATGSVPASGGPGISVLGAGQSGNELLVQGLAPNAANVFLAGDYLQLGSSSSARLHKVLKDVSADGLGAALLDIWPRLRSSPAHDAAVITSNPQGLFRLASNDLSFDERPPNLYGLSIAAIEAI